MMARRLWLGTLGWAAWAVAPLGAQTNTDLINLREDVSGLSQRLNELSLRVEQLEAAQNSAAHTVKPPLDAVTAAQLEAAVADLNSQLEKLRAATAAGQIPSHFSATITTTQAPAAAPAAPAAPVKKDPAPAARFSKQGIMYTVQKGDTVALIAKKTGAKFQDIVSANQLTDPSKIYPGQQLAVPGGK